MALDARVSTIGLYLEGIRSIDRFRQAVTAAHWHFVRETDPPRI